MTRSYAVGAYFEAFIDAQVKSGRFASASEVLREGLRLLDDREQRRLARLGVPVEVSVEAPRPVSRPRRGAPQLVSVDPDEVETRLASLEDRLRGGGLAATGD